MKRHIRITEAMREYKWKRSKSFKIHYNFRSLDHKDKKKKGLKDLCLRTYLLFYLR